MSYLLHLEDFALDTESRGGGLVLWTLRVEEGAPFGH